jgi:hypothetical protein
MKLAMALLSCGQEWSEVDKEGHFEAISSEKLFQKGST